MTASIAVEPQATWTDLVDRVRCGDQAGIEDLYAAVSDGARGRLFRNLDSHSAEDRLHEVLLTVIEAIRSGELREPERLMGFVRTVTRRNVAAHVRGAIFHRRRFLSFGDVEPVLSSEAAFEAELARRQRVERVVRIMSALRARDREILVRYYLREERPEKIQREMQLTETQFRLYKSRAIAKCLDLHRHSIRRRPASLGPRTPLP